MDPTEKSCRKGESSEQHGNFQRTPHEHQGNFQQQGGRRLYHFGILARNPVGTNFDKDFLPGSFLTKKMVDNHNTRMKQKHKQANNNLNGKDDDQPSISQGGPYFETILHDDPAWEVLAVAKDHSAGSLKIQ